MTSNLERTLTALDAWNRQDLDTYRTLYATGAVLHGLAPVPIDVDGALAGYRAFFAGFPDLCLDVLDHVSEENRLAIRFRVRGTQTGEFQGIPATGRAIDVEGMTILHFRDGQTTERWNVLDQMGMMQQLGVLPAAG